MTKRMFMIGLLMCGFVLLSTHEAKADDIFLPCTGSGSCTSGSVTQIATGTIDMNFVSNTSKTGDWEIAVLVPNGTASLTVNSTTATPTLDVVGGTAFSSGKLDSVLSSEENFGPNAYTFSSLASASAQAGVTATSFTVYEYTFGNFSSSGGGNPGISDITVSGAPVGSVIVGWIEVPGATSFQTPLSGSVTVPEAPTPALLGIGLVGLLLGAGVLRHRLALTAV